jgi:hypothetical protein
VAVIADEPLDSPGHDHVVRGQGAAIPEGNRNGHAIAADVDSALATGGCGVEVDPAHEPRCGAEVVELEDLADPVAVALPARQSSKELSRRSPWLPPLAILLDTIRLLSVSM